MVWKRRRESNGEDHFSDGRLFGTTWFCGLVPWNTALTRVPPNIETWQTIGRAVFLYWLEALGIQAVDHRVLDFIGIAEDVSGIKAQDSIKIVDARHVAIHRPGFDYMFPFSAEQFSTKYSLQSGRTYFQRTFRIATINRIIQRDAYCSGSRHELLCVERVTGSHQCSNCPTMDLSKFWYR